MPFAARQAAAADRMSVGDVLAGYPKYEEFAKRVRKIAADHPHSAAVASLGTTLGKRDMLLVVLSIGEAEKKPAMLIVGGVHAPHLVGGELALRVAEQLAAKSATDEATKKLLTDYTIYVIPRANPDGVEACFRKPWVERDGNDRATDDDRDGTVGEDPAEDLDGDGAIAQMRVADISGGWMSHPDDPRVLLRAEATKNEQGAFAVYSEGRDNDGDEAWNEDSASGVSLNRNFTFRYPFFKPSAGPHQVSEVESRALADFCYGRPNIAVVFTFTPEDNLMQPWKPNPQGEGRIKTKLQGGDAPYQDLLAEKYRSRHGGKDAPASAQGEGSFSEFAYFHYGRWSLAARGWWIPKVDAKPTPPAASEPAAAGDKTKDAAKPKEPKKPDGRAADELNALRWFDEAGIDGFAPWRPIEQPDFAGKKVEVGGFRPYVQMNPPLKLIDGLAEKHVQYVTDVFELLPKVSVDRIEVTPLGSGLFRVTANVVNRGFLPSMSQMGEINRKAYPLQLAIEMPKGFTFVQGQTRTQLPRLNGKGGKASFTWVIRGAADAGGAVKCTVYAPEVGTHSATADLK
jgi:hypothetical protein